MTQIFKNKQAAASLNVSAKYISKGTKKTRLQLGKTTSTAVFIAGKCINNPFEHLFAAIAVKSNRFVKFKSNNQTFLINVTSASKRLHCSKAQIQDTKKSDYASWITLQAEKTELALKNYNKIYNKYFSEQKVDHGRPLIYQGEETNLTSAELMSLIRSVIRSKTSTQFNLTQDKKIVILHLEGKISLEFMQDTIAEAGRSAIVTLSDKCCQKYVIKIPKDQECASDIEKENKIDSLLMQNELKIVQKLNQAGPQDGILLNAHLVKSYLSKGFALMMPYYKKGNYLDVCSVPLKSFDSIYLVKVMKEFEKLLHGLAYMHKKNIIHRGLDPENIFLQKDRVDIGDFTNSINFDDSDSYEKAYSSDYRCINDQENLMQLSKNNKDVVLIQKAMDVFAMGSIFHMRLSQELPYCLAEWENKGYWQDGSMRNNLPNKTPIHLKQLIHSMTRIDWQKRPSADTTYQFVKKHRIEIENQLYN